MMAELYLNKLDGTMQITVHQTRRLRFRIWCAVKLVALASRVLGTAVKVEVIEHDE